MPCAVRGCSRGHEDDLAAEIETIGRLQDSLTAKLRSRTTSACPVAALSAEAAVLLYENAAPEGADPLPQYRGLLGVQPSSDLLC
jgi:hypothetical protein